LNYHLIIYYKYNVIIEVEDTQKPYLYNRGGRHTKTISLSYSYNIYSVLVMLLVT